MIDSDAIKSLIDSVKEMVISLEDGATGLKPVVNLLAQLLKIISKIISVVPTGGLIASILGWKIGSAINLATLTKTFTKIFAWTKAYINILGPLKGAISGVGVAFKLLWDVLKQNPIGLIIVGVTTAVTLFSKIHKSAQELKQDAAEARQEAEEVQSKIDSLNQSLQEQQQLIDNLAGKKLNYIDEQQLKNARNMTAELKAQLEMEEEKLRFKSGEVASKTLKEWKKSDYYKLNLPSSYDNISGIDDESIENRQELVSLLSDLEDSLNTNQTYYNTLIKAQQSGKPLTTAEKDFITNFNNYSAIRDRARRNLYPTLWNESQFETINNTDNQKARQQMEQLKNKWKNKKYTYDFVPVSMIVDELESEGYEALREVVNSVTFSGDVLQEHNLETFAKQFWGTLKSDVEVEIKRNPIDLATWYTDSSSLDSDKTWKEITDSLFAGLDKITEFVKTHRAAGES